MKPSIHLRLRDEAQEKALKEYMEKNGLTQTEALRDIIDIALNMENEYAFLDDQPCPLRDFLGKDEAPPNIGNGWFCMQKAPRLTKLGSGIESAASKICRACQTRDGALEDSKTLKKQRTRGMVIFMPHCKRGAKLSEDMTELNCPEIGRWRPIKDRKKKTDPQPCHAKGMPPFQRCKSIEWTQLVIKGKLPDGENL